MWKRMLVKEWDKFGMFTVIKELKQHVYPSWSTRRKFRVKCICWKVCEKILLKLKNWHTKSCWCYRKRLTVHRNKTDKSFGWGKWKFFTTQEVEELRRLYKKWYSFKEIAKDVWCHFSTVECAYYWDGHYEGFI